MTHDPFSSSAALVRIAMQRVDRHRADGLEQPLAIHRAAVETGITPYRLRLEYEQAKHRKD